MNTTTPSLRSRLRGATLLAAAVALVAAVFAACSYDPMKGDLTLHINGLPQSTVRGEITLTDAAAPNNPKEYYPRWDTSAGKTQDLIVSWPTGAAAASLTVHVEAFDANDDLVGESLVTLASPGTELSLQVQEIGQDGSFGSRCATTDGGTQTCSSGLVCVQYQGLASRGVCSQSCTVTCPGSPTPAAACLDLAAGGKACQWECDQADGGISACPAGLVCQPQVSTSKKFCQPPQEP
jgi:hypothetical protein